jgi:hypothetical protein
MRVNPDSKWGLWRVGKVEISGGFCENLIGLEVRGPKGGYYGDVRLTFDQARELARDLLEAVGGPDPAAYGDQGTEDYLAGIRGGPDGPG